MEAPGSFILLSLVLLLVFGACIALGGAMWYLGWRTRKSAFQWLSVLPFGFGLFIVGPLLLLSIVLVIGWIVAAGLATDPPATSPPPPGQTD